MADNRQNSSRRTLGDYAMQQGPRHFSNIAIPPATKSLEMKPTFLSLINTHQFTGMDHEDPYTHLSTFYELAGGIIMTVDVEQAIRIIVALASTDYQAQHDRYTVQKKGVLVLQMQF